MIDNFYFNKHVCFSLIIIFLLSWRVSAQQSGTFVDLRDGHVYKWVQIGDQVWMAENLAYLPYVHSPNDKTTHPYKLGSAEIDYGVIGTPYQFIYGYNGNNVDIAKKTDVFLNHGVLYNFTSAMKSCPLGWHLPSDKEWKQMEKMIGMNSKELDEFKFSRGNVSGKLKSKLYWHEQSHRTDEYGLGFSPGGILFISPDIDNGAKFSDMGNGGYFWSSTEYNHPIIGNIGAFMRSIIDEDNIEMKVGNNHIGRVAMEKYYGLSVRCVKD